MSESESGAEKSLEPTEKRITEARERGEVARSRELGSAAVTIVTSATHLFVGGGRDVPTCFHQRTTGASYHA